MRRLKLAKLPRNSAPRSAFATAAKSRAVRGPFYRKLKHDAAWRCVSSARKGLVPGLVKSSW